MRPPVDEPEFRRWRDEADRALGGARREAKAANHNWSCFLAEQAAQLALKALLHGLGRGPWGHDVEALLESVADAGLDVGDEERAAARLLARHYIPARYPDAHPGSSPGHRYVADDSAQAVAAAERLLAFVDSEWESFG
jgi:HEPN domain-containing protein